MLSGLGRPIAILRTKQMPVRSNVAIPVSVTSPILSIVNAFRCECAEGTRDMFLTLESGRWHGFRCCRGTLVPPGVRTLVEASGSRNTPFDTRLIQDLVKISSCRCPRLLAAPDTKRRPASFIGTFRVAARRSAPPSIPHERRHAQIHRRCRG